MAIYTLKTTRDNLVGTTGKDAFNGTYNAAVTDTFSSIDTLNGGAGIDSLYINHLIDVAITPPDSLWSNLSNIERVVFNTTGNGAQTITTGANFQSAFAPHGVEFVSKTSGSGAINIGMSSYTGEATLRTKTTAGAQNIVTGSGATIVASAVSDAGALTIKGRGLQRVVATTTGAGAQTIGDVSGNGANLGFVDASSGSGAQTIRSTKTSQVIVKANSDAGKQVIVTGTGSDIITASTTSEFNTIDTRGGNDRITVAATASGNYRINSGLGNDTMTGGAGNDTLRGDSGRDILNGRGGADKMFGDDGSDLYFVNLATDVVTETNTSASTGGVDTVHSSLAAYVLPANVENGRITATGLANLTGNSLNNVLNGGVGNNKLFGNDGNDLLTGGRGHDSITGGSGNDSLAGSAGRDTLTGGSGSDIFDFNSLNDFGLTSATRDVITDFSRAQDRINLSTLDANTSTPTNDSFTRFIGSNAGFSAPGQLRLSGNVLSGNSDNDSSPEFSVQLNGINSLNTTDFIL